MCTSAYLVSGVADGTQLSASRQGASHFGNKHGGRLLTFTTGSRSWESSSKNQFQYFQVDLGLVTTVTAVATQGRDGFNAYVKSYRLYYSNDGNSWTAYSEGGTIKARHVTV